MIGYWHGTILHIAQPRSESVVEESVTLVRRLEKIVIGLNKHKSTSSYQIIKTVLL